MADTKSQVTKLFHDNFGHAPAGLARAPGRVNLLGEHVDYNDGWVLPAAIDRATFVAFSPTGTDRSALWAVDFDQHAEFSVRSLGSEIEAQRTELPDWASYPAGVAWALIGHGYDVKGIEAVFASDVARGAGLSSSASVELAFATAWRAAGGWTARPMELAVLCQEAENTYVGVNCGIMDQAASACGAADCLLLLDCRTLELQTLPLPYGIAIIIADTGVRHALTSTAYNDRRAACEEAVRILKQSLPRITALRDVSLGDFNRLAPALPAEVGQRARHVVEEIDRTKRGVRYLEVGDIAAFGGLMNECHRSLRNLYEVSCPELDAMAHIAQSLDGCYGARLTGAGFGGCTVNLVAKDQADLFTEALAARYRAQTGLRAEIHLCRPSAGAGLV
jgi:galactokinase